MHITDPGGSFLTESNSLDNSYEVAEFTPSTTGYYSVKVSQSAVRDVDSKFKMGISQVQI